MLQEFFCLDTPTGLVTPATADSELLMIPNSSDASVAPPNPQVSLVAAYVAAASLDGGGSISAEPETSSGTDSEAMVLDDANVLAVSQDRAWVAHGATYGGLRQDDGYSSDGSMPSLRTISDSSEESAFADSDSESV